MEPATAYANKFEHAKIYRISSLSLNLTYYGSTLNRLSQRMAQHRAACKAYKSGKAGCTYYTSFEVLEADDAAIFLVETFKCNNIEELRARERHFIENNVCVNKHIPGRTTAEYQAAYRAANQEALKAYFAEYRAANKETIQAYQAEYRAANKDALNANQAAYRAANQEALKAYFAEYYVANWAKLNANHACPCGGKFTTQHRAAHEKTKKHCRFIAAATPVAP